jgi:hypothetical protein
LHFSHDIIKKQDVADNSLIKRASFLYKNTGTSLHWCCLIASSNLVANCWRVCFVLLVSILKLQPFELFVQAIIESSSIRLDLWHTGHMISFELDVTFWINFSSWSILFNISDNSVHRQAVGGKGKGSYSRWGNATSLQLW